MESGRRDATVWLDNARIVAMAAVVLLHTAADGVVTSEPGSRAWWIANLYDSLLRWCVPVFVMISGALLLDPARQESPRAFYVKRVARLAVPLLFWSVFFTCWTFLKGWRKGAPPPGRALLGNLAGGQPYFHLWFLYMILGLYLLTPLLRRILRDLSRRQLLTLVVAALVVAAANAVLEASRVGCGFLPLSCLSFVPYFLLGHWVRTQASDPPRWAPWCVLLLSAAATAVGFDIATRNLGREAGLYFYGYLSAPVLAMSWSAIHLFRRWNRPIGGEVASRQLAALTLGIYLIHPLAMEAFRMLGVSASIGVPALSIPAIAAAVYACALAAAWVLQKVPYLRKVI